MWGDFQLSVEIDRPARARENVLYVDALNINDRTYLMKEKALFLFSIYTA